MKTEGGVWGRGRASRWGMRVQNDQDGRLTAICAALKPEIYAKLLRYSARRCRWLARMGLAVDGGSVEEFVADAITDTVTGRRTWPPDACDLLTHLFGVIRSRTADFFRRHGEILVRGDGTDHEAGAGGCRFRLIPNTDSD